MPTGITYHANALGPLRNVVWTVPAGVSAIVGPNRVGKSALLRLPEFLRIAVNSDLETSVRDVFRGSAFLRNFTLPASASCTVGLSIATQDVPQKIKWTIELMPKGATVVPFPAERVMLDDVTVFERKFGSDSASADGEQYKLGSNLIPRFCVIDLVRLQNPPDIPQAQIWTNHIANPKTRHRALAGLVCASAHRSASYRTYEYQIQHLLRYGSPQSAATVLQSSGENVFPLLRNWRDQSELEPRYEFVLDTLREAFPHVQKFDFESSGQTVTIATVDRRWSTKTPIAYESTGLITALLQLCAVASASSDSTITIDELETSLHPHAIRVLIAAFRRWAREHDLRIVLATQSETVLDQFRDEPEKIFVMEARQETSPQPLTEMFGADWLKQFSLGDLFSHLEFGAPDLPQG